MVSSMPFDEIAGIFGKRGAEAYFGESVSVTEHALQAAWFAQQEGAAANLVVAALLHDVGHLIQDLPDDLAEWTEDEHHEQIGAAWLARRFGPEVSDPVRLHVAAKRYLCATEPDYFSNLSPASVRTLQLQGGPMPAGQLAAFERETYFREALRVRRWDDRAKVADLKVPGLSAFRALIESQAGSAVHAG
jgi:[1-hydroxy-2-(trimethylamino)ethyl]phosphonate dioxygenase